LSRPLPEQTIKLGNLTLGGPQALICTPSAELGNIYRWSELPAEQRPDLFEWRQDLSIVNPIFPSILQLILRELPPLPMPLIVTRRRQQEGGAAKDSQHRFNLLLTLAEIASAIDIELKAPQRDQFIAALSPEIPLIVSWHDFSGTPPLDKLKRIISEGGAVRGGRNIAVKFATMAHAEADADTTMQALSWARGEGFPGPLIGIAMGEFGQRTRSEAACYGSDLSYARVAEASAPGQLTVAETRKAVLRAGC
jgi:3-dehydroquinate dehydratase-1